MFNEEELLFAHFYIDPNLGTGFVIVCIFRFHVLFDDSDIYRAYVLEYLVPTIFSADVKR